MELEGRELPYTHDSLPHANLPGVIFQKTPGKEEGGCALDTCQCLCPGLPCNCPCPKPVAGMNCLILLTPFPALSPPCTSPCLMANTCHACLPALIPPLSGSCS